MKLSSINNLLLILVIIINAYTIAAPLLPALIFAWDHHQGRQQQLMSDIRPTAKPSAALEVELGQPNHVVIPSMLLDTPILEGPISQTYKILDKGIWRWPKGSTPDKGGNTVLIGHRFTYTNPHGIFYFLNKVIVGDDIAVFWDHKEYVYDVVSTATVKPTNTSILSNTSNAELTLFTCTPLWLPKDRMVVVADLMKVQS